MGMGMDTKIINHHDEEPDPDADGSDAGGAAGGAGALLALVLASESVVNRSRSAASLKAACTSIGTRGATRGRCGAVGM